MKRITIVSLISLFVLGAMGWFVLLRTPHDHDLVMITDQKGSILYYTCSMHPGVRITPAEHEKGNNNCPICSMPLLAIKKEKESVNNHDPKINLKKETIVKLNQTENWLINVQTAPVQIQNVFKQIRTVGQVAYDPQLLVAQEEFVAALIAAEKLDHSIDTDVQNRSISLIDSTKHKLSLLGMTKTQIEDLKTSKAVDTNLLLPETSAWIYADIYEHESSWVKAGQKVMVYSESIPDKMFDGVVKAIDPILKTTTRTQRARILIKTDPKYIFQPNAYVDIYIKVPLGKQITIPKSAVLDTGTRQIVYIAKYNHSYMQREVEIGPEAIIYHDEHKIKVYPVYNGLEPNQLVVTKANFLIDSQSQIGAAASAFGGALGEKETSKPKGHSH